MNQSNTSMNTNPSPPDGREAVVQVPVASLKNHPVADLVAMVSEENPEFIALRESIAENGILQPLLISEDHEVADGRHRLRAAKLLGLETVPCVVKSRTEGATIALNTALARRRFNEGQVALICALLYPASAEERKARRLANLKKGPISPQILEAAIAGSGGLKTQIVALAKAHGVSEDSLQRAYKVLDLPQPKRNALVGAIMDGRISLGGAVAGLAGEQATKGKPKRPLNYLKLFTESLGALKKLSRAGWKQIKEPAARNYILRLAHDLPASLPDELLAELKRGIRELETLRKEQGK